MQHFKKPALVLAAYLGTFLASLDISIVNVALPTLQRALQTDLAGLQWVINAYAIALSAFMLSAGPLSDRHGHRRMWLASVATFIAGSLVCACATDLPVLVIGRTIQGVAGALLIPSAMPLLTHAFPDPGQRARAIGGWSAFSALALVLGPLLGGLLVQWTGWQSIFLINLPLGAVALALGAWSIPERRHPQHAAMDPAGQILSTLALAALSYGLIGIGGRGWSAPATWFSLITALVALLAFSLVQRRVTRPLLPLDLFADRRFALLNLASFVLGFTAYASLFFLSLFFQQVQGKTAAQAGWQLAPQFLVMGVVSLMFGRIAVRLGLHAALAWGYALAGLALCAMARFTTDTAGGFATMCLMALGAGMGLAVPATGMAVNGAHPTGTRRYRLSHHECPAPSRDEPGHRIAWQPDEPVGRTAVPYHCDGNRAVRARTARAQHDPAPGCRYGVLASSDLPQRDGRWLRLGDGHRRHLHAGYRFRTSPAYADAHRLPSRRQPLRPDYCICGSPNGRSCRSS